MLAPRFAALAAVVTLLAACGGGPSDVVGSSGLKDAHTRITLVTYAVPEPGWSKIIPAFNDSEEGDGIEVTASYGASADQSRGVADGKPADVVNFSVEPDITRLVDAGKVSPSWNEDATKGIPFGSVVALVVRAGNPKNIRGWDDLLRPGIEVVTPSPLSSGSAKWNLLAPYAVKSDAGKNPQAGLDFVTRLVNDHVTLRPASGREATDVFVQGSGDVLISYENEAIEAQRQGKPIEHVVPEQTFKIDNPVAVLTTSRHLSAATAFKNFLYTPTAQRIWAQAGFRPVDPAAIAEFRDRFPAPKRLFTIADLGGWDVVDPQLFAKNTGAITAIYLEATG